MIGRWYDYQFKGLDNGMADEEPVQIWVLGENKWRGESGWPLKRAVDTQYYLRSGGNANTVWGDGSLGTEPPGTDERHDTYVYDPRDPLMSLMREDAQAAPVDQSPHDHRQDVLVYQTPPLEHDLELVGPVKLVLHAATDGPDTDWTAKLAVVFEDGLAINLTYGIMRAQHREGYDNPKLLEPGRAYDYEIKLNPIGCLFKKGQRIRLYVSSSDFPNFDRNHNNGRDYWSDSELRPARQSVFHDAARPSHLVLPVIPR
jgi:putative CocE/NonD family hydrolase